MINHQQKGINRMMFKMKNPYQSNQNWRILWIVLLSTVFLLIGLSSKFFTPIISAQNGNLGQGKNQVFIADQRVDIGRAAQPAYQVQYNSIALNVLNQEVTFSILHPQKLPPGTELISVEKVTSVTDGVGVELQYRTSKGKEIWITESNPSQPIRLYIEQHNVIQQVDINGYQGVLYKTGAASNSPLMNQILTWTDGKRWFEMRGSVTSEELIEIAQSIGH